MIFMLEIKKGRNSFYIGESEENPLGKIGFVNSSDKFIIADHTEVSDELKGKSAGKHMLKELVDWAESENKKIMPLCKRTNGKKRRLPQYDIYAIANYEPGGD